MFSIVGVDPNQQGYFQWPSFFILNTVLVEILGLSVNTVSVIVFLVIGFLLSSSLFLFFLQENEKLGFLGVAFYFMGLFWFLNYQFAPQSLALGLFLMLVNLTFKRDLGFRIASLLVFVSLVFMHSFIPVLFLLFYFILAFRDRGSLNAFLLYTAVYVAFVIYFAIYYFHNLVQTLINVYFAFGEYGEYARIVQTTLTGPISALDAVAQIFSRGIILSIWLMLFTGFIIRILKRDVNLHNLALFFTGFIHLILGTFLNLLGGRALQVIFIPLAAGYKSFLNKYWKIMTACLLLIFALFPFVVMHAVYDIRLVQTASGERASEMLIKSLKIHVSILSASTDGYYIYGSVPRATVNIVTPRSRELEQLLISRYDYVIYNPLLEKEALYAYGFSISQIQEFKTYFLTRYNIAWDDGYSRILSAR